jgi:hypothetical protein
MNSRHFPTYTNRRYFEFAREPYACFHSTRIAAKGAIFIYLECFQHSGNSSVVASYLSGRQQQKVFDSGGALTVVVFYRLPLHAASPSAKFPFIRHARAAHPASAAPERCRPLPWRTISPLLVARASRWIRTRRLVRRSGSVVLWPRGRIPCVATGQVPVGADERSQEHRPPLSQPLSAFVLPSACDLSQSQPTARRILAA